MAEGYNPKFILEFFRSRNDQFKNITIQQLTAIESNPGVAQSFYAFVVQNICSNEVDFNQPSQNAIEQAEIPAEEVPLHENSFPLSHFSTAIFCILDMIGISDFRISDFVRPTTKRFRYYVSHLISVCMHVESVSVEYLDPLRHEMNAVIEKKAALADMIEDLRIELAEQERQHASAEKRAEELGREAEELEHEVNRRKVEMQQTQSLLTRKESECQEKEAAVKRGQTDIVQLEREIVRMESHILKSPEKFTARIASMRTERTQLQTEIKELETKQAEWIEKIDYRIPEWMDVLAARHKAMDALKTQLGKLAEVKAEVAAAEEELRQEKLKEAESLREREHLKQQQHFAQMKLQKEELRQNRHLEQLRGQVSNLRTELAEMQERKNQDAVTAQSIDDEIVTARRQLEEMRMAHTNNMEKMRDMAANVVAQVVDHEKQFRARDEEHKKLWKQTEERTIKIEKKTLDFSKELEEQEKEIDGFVVPNSENKEN